MKKYSWDCIFLLSFSHKQNIVEYSLKAFTFFLFVFHNIPCGCQDISVVLETWYSPYSISKHGYRVGSTVKKKVCGSSNKFICWDVDGIVRWWRRKKPISYST